MKKTFLLISIAISITSCSSIQKKTNYFDYSTVEIDTLLNEKMSCRALLIDDNTVWFASNANKFGAISLKNKEVFLSEIKNNDLQLEFRSSAQTRQSVFVLSVENPALLYKIDKKTKKTTLVYEERHEKVFYDSMLFMNEKEGIAIGDPTENCPSVLLTNDGGASWKKLPCNNLPKFADGEAFFAASNTNINYKNETLIMVSGGKKSKVYISKNKGQTWQEFETPIIQGRTMTGAFTSDFYDQNNGIIAGGDYEKPLQNFQNKAITSNGGQTWQLVSENQGFGYASCIQYLPNTNGKCLLEMGANGIFYSNDNAKTWKKLAPDTDFITFRFVDEKTVVASGKNRIVRIRLN